MLNGTLEMVFAFASLICMFFTIVCIVFCAEGSRSPIFVSVIGCVFYVMFLLFAKNNMDTNQQHTYFTLLFAYVFFVLAAEGFYHYYKMQKKAAFRLKFEEFKLNCSEARRNAKTIDVA